MEQVSVVVPAAGIGSRMGATIPKQYLSLAGKPLLAHTLERLFSHPAVGEVILALAPDDDHFVRLGIDHAKLRVVEGGATRADSVARALEAVTLDWVLVHDAARPCITHSDIDKLLAVTDPSGAILAMRVRDTMKRGNAKQQIVATVEREDLWHALTPQYFPTLKLKQALQAALAAGHPVTDEASALEFLGEQPLLIEGRGDNIKVTRPEDLLLAELYLQQQQEQA